MILISSDRQEKLNKYNGRYDDIPRDFQERLNWMIDKYHLTPNKMDEIITKKRNMEMSLFYNRVKIVLYEDPEGAKRPRFRLINRKNYMDVAMESSHFVQVYSPNAMSDSKYLHRLIDSELVSLRWFVQTPCRVTINAFTKTPSYFNSIDVFLAEIGLHQDIMKPDWDNISKKYCDMFNKNIWLDDSFVISGTANKFYSVLPRIEIYVDYLNYATNIHQYKRIIGRNDYNPEFEIGYLGKDGKPFNGN